MNLRANIAFHMDSAFPRDDITINPHYAGDNAQALADALARNLKASSRVGATFPFTIKVYDAEKPPPSYPLATAVNGTGFLANIKPREVALCLSYYSTYNRPTYRGRLYIPGHFISGSLGIRPTPTQRDDALAWATLLTDQLPANHTWIIWSRKTRKGWTVSDCWVDDEWDIQRSRGLKGTTRTLLKVQ